MGQEDGKSKRNEKLTPRQREFLSLLIDGAHVHYVMGIRRPGSYSIRKNWPGAGSLYQTFPRNVFEKFRQMGLLKMVSDPAWSWRDAEYTISEKGKELVNSLK